jgi:hypothetical protein
MVAMPIRLPPVYTFGSGFGADDVVMAPVSLKDLLIGFLTSSHLLDEELVLDFRQLEL